MHYPLDGFNPLETGITRHQRPERYQDTFTSALNLRELDDKAILASPEFAEHRSRSCSKDHGLTMEHQRFDLFGR